MKILSLELENIKRIKALRLVPSANGLTVIGGRNGQGKTSVLDAIAFGFGGASYKPGNIKRDGAVGDSVIRIETDNGLIVERKGKNSSLTVTDKNGQKGGQAILDKLISKLAIDLPKFLSASAKEKANILLETLGIGQQLAQLERDEKAAYDKRLVIGRQKEQKEKAAADMPTYEDAPEELVSAADIVKEQQAVMARNAKRQAVRNNLTAAKTQRNNVSLRLETLREQVKELEAQLVDLDDHLSNTKEPDPDEDVSEFIRKLDEIEVINDQVRANARHEEAVQEAAELKQLYDDQTAEVEEARKAKMDLLNGADLPYPGLTVEDGVLLLNGKTWDCMSSSEQLMVGTAIAARINPSCKFVLLDKLEQLDRETLDEFAKWLEEHDIQAIATRVSDGDECTLIIEDGEAVTKDGRAPIGALENFVGVKTEEADEDETMPDY